MCNLEITICDLQNSQEKRNNIFVTVKQRIMSDISKSIAIKNKPKYNGNQRGLTA